MPPRQQHDPFTDAPLRPSMRGQTSQQSLRSNASAASTRPRQPRELFAPALSRRPTSRTTPRVEDEVLADPDSGEELAVQRQRHGIRKPRQGSPEKHGRMRARQDEDLDVVHRQPDGSYLLDVGTSNNALTQHMYAPEVLEEKAEAETDAFYTALARQYFMSGMAAGARSGRKSEDDPTDYAAEMMLHLRRQALQKIDDERWMFEPLDRFQSRLP